MSDAPDQGGTAEPQFSEEELRALEAELEKINVDEVILQTIVSLVNLGARKGALGAPPEAGVKPDWEQVREAIEAVRALLGVIETKHGDKLGPIREAVSQLQMAYAAGSGAAAGAPASASPRSGAGDQPPQPQGPGGAQSSGRLWVPGQ